MFVLVARAATRLAALLLLFLLDRARLHDCDRLLDLHGLHLHLRGLHLLHLHGLHLLHLHGLHLLHWLHRLHARLHDHHLGGDSLVLVLLFLVRGGAGSWHSLGVKFKFGNLSNLTDFTIDHSPFS